MANEEGLANKVGTEKDSLSASIDTLSVNTLLLKFFPDSRSSLAQKTTRKALDNYVVNLNRTVGK